MFVLPTSVPSMREICCDRPGDSLPFPMTSKSELDQDLNGIQREITVYHQYQRYTSMAQERRRARVNALYY
jgi:hypothetical protein